MSMMMPPDPSAAPGLPVPPGGGGAPGPMDSLNQGPIPAGGGMAGLLDALGGAGGGPPGAGPPDGGPDLGALLGGGGEPGSEAASDEGGMDPVEHIQQAMKHLMMALAKDTDEERGGGIVKGMGALQGILGGEQKSNKQLSQLGA